MVRRLHLKVPPDLQRLAQLGCEVHTFLQNACVDPHRAHRCEVVLEEVLTNVLRHGRRGDRAPAAEVEVTVDGDALQVCVTDDGPAFDPTAAPPLDPTTPLEARSEGGMGILLLQRLTRRLAYERRGEHNRLQFDL